jgi:Pectate lyase superfamily protein
MPTPGPTSPNMQSLTEPFIDVKRDFAAQGDGTTDDSTAINNAISAASTRFGAGTVYFPPGTYLCKSTITLKSQVHLRGSGIEATIIKLANAVNADLMSANTNLINLAAASGTSDTGGIYNWSLIDLTLDGNRANQSSGTSYCLRLYGFGFILHNVRLRNGYSGGLLSDWNGGGTSGIDSMEAQISNVKIHDCNGIGLQWGGPHDSQFSNLLVFKSGSHNIHIAPNATAIIMTNCHSWGSALGNSSVSFLIEAGYGQYANCIAEGSDTCNVVLLGGEIIWSGGHIFGAGVFSVTGIQFGQQAGNTPYNASLNQAAGVTTAVTCGGCRISSIFSHNEGANGALWFANDGGNNLIDGCFFQAAGNILTGTLDPRTVILTSTNGLTADGTIGKGGICKWPIKANQALLVTDRTNDVFNVNTNNKRIELVNGTLLRLYSDTGYANRTVEISGGTVSLLQSTSAAAIANGNTITTSGVGIARVNPAANVTGIILQAGTLNGQQVWVVNESAFTVTFAAANSNVADANSSAIAANTARLLVWDGGVNLWFRAA